MYLNKQQQYNLFRLIVRRLTEKDRRLITEKYPDALAKSKINVSCLTYIDKIKTILDVLEHHEAI